MLDHEVAAAKTLTFWQKSSGFMCICWLHLIQATWVMDLEVVAVNQKPWIYQKLPLRKIFAIISIMISHELWQTADKQHYSACGLPDQWLQMRENYTTILWIRHICNKIRRSHIPKGYLGSEGWLRRPSFTVNTLVDELKCWVWGDVSHTNVLGCFT